MPSNLRAQLQAGLVERNLEHEPVYWMSLTEAEAQDLSRGIVPEPVRSMAEWLCEPLAEMVARKKREQVERDIAEGDRLMHAKQAAKA